MSYILPLTYRFRSAIARKYRGYLNGLIDRLNPHFGLLIIQATDTFVIFRAPLLARLDDTRHRRYPRSPF